MTTPTPNASPMLPVPYMSKLTHSVEPGQTLHFQGRCGSNCEQFEINMKAGNSGTNPLIALHVNVRLNENKLVLNSCENGEWGKEIREKNSLTKKGETFDLRIRVHEDRYEVLANGKEVAEFPHRVAWKNVDHLEILGDIELTSVRRGGRYHTLPFETQFQDGHLKAGEIVLIDGIPIGDRFEVNFLDRSGNILFHFNPRINEKKVVRSAYIDGNWGPEEREGTQPFKKNHAFDLVIQNQPFSLQIFVNNERFATFAHRCQDPKHDYASIRVDGQVELTGLEISLASGQTHEY